VGHVFVEVYVDGKWVLIDPTNGWYVDDGYDPVNPVIPLKGPIAGSTEEIYGFYVECKGVDTWDFGIHSPSESTRAMDEFGKALDFQAITYPQYTFGHFSR
jgi:transglutaminase-like putative cysteine protease